MSLFQAKAISATSQSDYTAKDIEVLEGLEPVRRRPGMYIGGTDERALHHLIAEVLDNAMDEVVAQFATSIEIVLEADNVISIRDNGRGIPIDPHPKFPDKSALEVIFTTLHSGGKFDSKVYDTSGGLHGVGISVVNALSDDLHVEVYRNKEIFQQRYSRGMAVSALEKLPEATRKRGTLVRFHPDPEIFGDLSFKARLVYQMAKAKAYLFKGVEINWSCDSKLVAGTDIPAKAKLLYPKGLLDYLKTDETENAKSEDQYFFGESTFSSKQGRVEWAVEWYLDKPRDDEEEDAVISFCNTIPTPQGGTHEAGFRQALLRGLRDYADRIGHKKFGQTTGDDVAAISKSVMSCFIQQPQFQGQTKEKLVSSQATKLVENAIKDNIDHWLADHPQLSNQIIEAAVQQTEERLRKRQAKEVSRASATRKLRLPGKLADCTSTDASVSELFIVEGDSAGGSAKQARARATQAVLPLKGKILNVATASIDKLKANQQILDLGLALGCGTGKNCDVNKLRYHKIIIMTDADVDGAHIASLIMTFFFQEMRHLITAGHIYLALPPLYRLAHGGTVHYAKDDAEKDQLLKTVFKKYTKVDISRFKGLGEMPVDQLRATTMDPTKRRLQKVYIKDSETINDFVNRLMGKNADARYQFIQENATFVQDLDI